MFKQVDYKNRKDVSKFEKIQRVTRQRDNYEHYWERDLQRYQTNAKAMWGIDYGMWPQVVVEELKRRKMNPKTFNVTLDKVETFIGSVMGNGYDIRFSPTTGKLDSLVLKLQDMYYSDKKEMVWEHAEMEALLDAACGVGYISMFVSSKNHHLGNISFKRRNPKRTLLSPSWKSSDLNELHDWMTWGKFSVKEIKEFFPNTSARLDELYEQEKRDNINYGINPGILDYKDANEKWNDLHTVIELHWVEKKRAEWEYDKKNGCMFPETGEKFHSDKDIAEKMKYVQKMGLTQDDITLRLRTNTIKYIRAICPTLDAELMLLDDPDLIQCGNVNLFPIGMKLDGQYQGLVDRIIDPNRALNEYEMMMDMIHKRGPKEAVVLDKALAGGDQQLEDEIEEAWAQDGIIWVAEGTTSDLGPTGGVLKLPRATITADYFRREEGLLSLTDRLSKVSPAEEARTEFAGEPNKTFENKIAIGKINKWFYSKIYELFQRERAIAYARQAKHTYSGDEREFGIKDGKETFKINKRVVNPETGVTEIHDDISMLPDVKVSVYLSRDGIDIQSQLRSDVSNILQSVAQDPNDRPIKLDMLQIVIGTIPLPDEEKEVVQKDIELLQLHSRLSVAAAIKQMMAVLNPQPQAIPINGRTEEGPKSQAPQQKSLRSPTEEESLVGTAQDKNLNIQGG